MKIFFKISLSHEYLRRGCDDRDTRFTEILRNRKPDHERKETKIRSSQICRTFVFVATMESHMPAIVSLLNPCWRSRRDCFALISRLNIQSSHRDELAQVIISQADKSKWYLCPRAISRHDDIFTFFAFYSAPLGNGTYFEARRLADNSRWKRWTEHFFWSVVLFAPFLCCFEGSASQCTSSILFEISCSILFHLISRDCEVDYLKTTLLLRKTFIIFNNIYFVLFICTL